MSRTFDNAQPKNNQPAFDVITPHERRKSKTRWHRIGAAWPSEDGNGFDIQLFAHPLGDCLLLRTPKPKIITNAAADENADQ